MLPACVRVIQGDGVNEESIVDILREMESRGLSADQKDDLSIETFKMARDMARLGVISSQTVTLVNQALQHQFTANQMQNLRSSIMHNSRATDPHSLVASFGKAIEQGKSFDSSGSNQMSQGGNQGPTGGHGSGPGGSGSGSGGGSDPGGSGGGPGGSGSDGGSGPGGGGSGGGGPGGSGGSGGHN